MSNNLGSAKPTALGPPSVLFDYADFKLFSEHADWEKYAHDQLGRPKTFMHDYVSPMRGRNTSTRKHLEQYADYYQARISFEDLREADVATIDINLDGYSFISLGYFVNAELMVCAFFHEIGHLLHARQMRAVGMRPFSDAISKISSEGIATELGMIEARKHGFDFVTNLECKRYLRRCLLSYIQDSDCMNQLLYD